MNQFLPLRRGGGGLPVIFWAKTRPLFARFLLRLSYHFFPSWSRLFSGDGERGGDWTLFFKRAHFRRICDFFYPPGRQAVTRSCMTVFVMHISMLIPFCVTRFFSDQSCPPEVSLQGGDFLGDDFPPFFSRAYLCAECFYQSDPVRC